MPQSYKMIGRLSWCGLDLLTVRPSTAIVAGQLNPLNCPKANSFSLLMKNPDFTHPMREDVKRKHFSTPLGETSIVACIQALLLRGEDFGFNAKSRHSTTDVDRGCWSSLSGFM